MNKILETLHHYAIFYNEKRDRWETTIPQEGGERKRIVRKTQEDLERYLLEIYKAAIIRPTFATVYPEFMAYKNKMRAGTTISYRPYNLISCH